MIGGAPCRVCGSSRDAHDRFPHEHRYRAEIYCDDPSHVVPKEATWFVTTLTGRTYAMCSAHKGAAIRAGGEANSKVHRGSDYYR